MEAKGRVSPGCEPGTWEEPKAGRGQSMSGMGAGTQARLCSCRGLNHTCPFFVPAFYYFLG